MNPRRAVDQRLERGPLATGPGREATSPDGGNTEATSVDTGGSAPTDWLDQARIERALRAQLRGGRVEVLKEVDSTNAHLMRAGHTGDGERHVCFAEQQTAGRGRRHRQWRSPLGGGVWLSMLEAVPGRLSLAGLSLAAGVSVADAATELGLSDTGLKWPNDVQWRGKKLAGILIETTSTQDPAQRGLIVGVGINCHLPAGTAIDQPWTDLSSALAVVGRTAPSRNDVAICLARHMLRTLEVFVEAGFGAFERRFAARDVLHGKEVVVSDDAFELSGRSLGVDENGALRLETKLGARTVVAGHVRLDVPPDAGCTPASGHGT